MNESITNMVAWQRQKALQKKYHESEVPDIDELVNIINDIQLGTIDPLMQTNRARALFALYYLTACRASEVVEVRQLRRQKETKDAIEQWTERHNYIGIKKRDIKLSYFDNKRVLLIRTENRKNKVRKTKRQPIPIEFEKDIARFLINYLKTLQADQILFPFKVKRATQIITQTTGFNIHFIRHIRATHLVTLYQFSEESLIRFMGWTDGRPAQRYVELSPINLFREFYKTK